MKISFVSFLTSVLLLALTTAAYAETRYVSDYLVVTVRSNKTKNYTTLASLPTASPVEILDEDATFVKVRTSKGVEGYVSKQYVSKELPKATQISRLKKQKETLEKRLQQQLLEFQQTSGQATSSQSQIKELTENLTQSRQQFKKVSAEYEQLQKQAGNVINLTNERDHLLEENSQFLTELTVLQEENKGFHRSNMIQWFLAGGGVFLVGWLVGKISRKKRSYNSF